MTSKLIKSYKFFKKEFDGYSYLLKVLEEHKMNCIELYDPKEMESRRFFKSGIEEQLKVIKFTLNDIYNEMNNEEKLYIELED